MDSKHNPFTDLQRCNVRCNVRYKMTGTLSMRTSSACLMRWMRRTPCEHEQGSVRWIRQHGDLYRAASLVVGTKNDFLRWGARGSLLLLAPFLPQAPAARPCPPGLRGGCYRDMHVGLPPKTHASQEWARPPRAEWAGKWANWALNESIIRSIRWVGRPVKGLSAAGVKDWVRSAPLT